MKRFRIAFVALGLAFAAFLPTAIPVGAAGGACGNWFDSPGTVYAGRDYQSKDWNMLVGGTAHTDIQDAQYTNPSDGRCYAAYRVSVWGPGGSDYYAYLRTWVCGHAEPNNSIGTVHNASGQQVVSQNWDGFSAGNGAFSIWVDAWHAQALFIDVSGCGFQADNLWSAAANSGWSAAPASSVCGVWYANIPNGNGC